MQVWSLASRIVPALWGLLLAVLLPAIATAQQADVVLAVGTITSDNYPGQEFSGKALSELIEHEAVTMLGDGGSFAWCVGRLALQQTPYVDQAIAIHTPGTDAPDFVIGGSITHGAGKAVWTIEVRSNPGGELVDSFTGTADDDALLDEAASIAKHLLDKLCPGPRTVPGPWTVTGGSARMVVSGTVTKLDEPFVVTGKFPGGTADFVYSPTSRGGGTVEYVLAGGGFSGAGKGTYTIGPSGDGSTLTIKQTTKGCMNGIPGSCKTNSEVLTLTPGSALTTCCAPNLTECVPLPGCQPPSGKVR